MHTNFNFNHAGSIESTIASVADILAANSPAGTTVEKKKSVKGKCLQGIITVTPTKSPKVTYVFYASTYRPSQLGSVAIYTEDRASTLALIRQSKSLFGFRVVDATIEYGRRPFIDVTLAL